MREAVNEEYMKMLSEDYEYDLANVKKCWILLTNIYDCIPLFNDILRSVKDTYPMKTKIDEEKSKKLFYRMED